MASTAESSLIFKLETVTSPPIYPLFTSYLSPFIDLTQENPKKPKDQTLKLRSLAKQYLQFLNKSLSILPKRLSNPSDLDGDLSRELFDTYRLCLDCLESVASQLSCKPCTIQTQRIRLVYCLEAAGRYEDAQSEGFRVLEKLRGFGEFGDREVVEVVAAIAKCVALGQSKDAEQYTRLVRLLEENSQVLDGNTYEKLHRVLVTYLGKCALFLVGELSCFDEDFVREFCETALKEYAKFPMKDQIYKFARRFCSSLFLLQENRTPLIIDILKCVLASTARACKVQVDNGGIEFVELISYCANKCRTAGTMICSTVARHLAVDFDEVMGPLGLILRLYANGLHFTDCDFKYRGRDFISSGGAKEKFVIKILLDDEDGLYNLAALRGSLDNYFHIGCKGYCVSSSIEYKDSKASVTCTQTSRKAYLLSYLNALKFLCQPLAELVNSEKKQMVAEFEAASVSSQLCDIQDAFHQFCDVVLFFHGERDGFDDNKTILNVVVAAFILSVSTKLKFQKSVRLIKQIISSEWIEPQGLKYLFSSLYNISVLLYRNKQVKEASKALKLCCRASWTCVVLLCQRFVPKSKGLQDDLSEDAIVHFVSEACTRSAFLLDMLHQCGSLKVKKVVAESLESWSVAGTLFRTLPGPMPLVKQWVKVECELHKNVDVEDSAPMLYCSLEELSEKLSSAKISKRTIGKILEQVLLAYEEMNSLYPELSHQMQMKIKDILLQDEYVTRDSCLQISRILLRRGRTLRASGIEGLNDCIQCLSEAISIMRSLGTPPHHQLAVAYCLRALCYQEAEPNSKLVFADIKAALNLWLSISIPDDCSVDDECNLMSENTVLLLYNVVDLLSMKGCTKFHHDIYELVIRLFKWKNVPLEKCVAILWECRRLSHALCVSPINEAFITKLSEHFGELSQPIDFWIRCLEGFEPLIVGFQQNFTFLFTNVPHGAYNHESSFRSDITVDDVKEAASKLLVTVPIPNRSVFLAGYLYYDLCERLISNGRLFEALSYAKEAHRLRTQLFQEKFRYSVEQHVEKYSEAGDIVEKLTYGLRNFQVFRSVASEAWSFDSISWDLNDFYISPWNVLQSYLESTLQLGIIHELIGNGVEAETFLLWGKNISCLQSLPLFTVAFSSVLGKLYRKKWLWNLAEKELASAEMFLENSDAEFADIFLENSDAEFTCLKCRLILEVTVEQQLGDLFRSRFDGTPGNIPEEILSPGNIPIERLSRAQNRYQSALKILNRSEWKNSISCPEEESDEGGNNVDYGGSNPFTHSVTTQLDAMERFPTRKRPKAKLDARKCRTKNAPKPLVNEQSLVPEQNSRLTRSKYRSSENQSVSISFEVQPDLSKPSKGNNEVACICQQLKCWNCLLMEVMESGMLNNLIHVKWELVRRRLSLRVLTGKGKCLGDCDQIHETHEIILKSISVLVSRNPFCHTSSPVPLTIVSFLLDLLGKEFPRDVFAVERATILYNLSWFLMKSYHSKESIVCCELSHIQLPNIVSWLKLAFVLCREVPMLFQKVSRLLAAIYILSASSVQFSLSSSCKALSENYWASYFHQASLGTHLNYQFFSNRSQRCKSQHLVDAEGLHVTVSTGIGAETSKLLRLAPESVQDLEQFVRDFFVLLPCTTVICISLLGGAFASLIREFLCYPSCVHAWMLLSRLNSKSQPVVILLPVNSISEEISDDENCGSGEFSEGNGLGKHWHCPWGSTVVDDVAPAFKRILEENYLSSSIFPLEDTKKNRTLWWMQRKKLDHCLGKLLRKLEDSWLGPWRYLLMGEWSNCQRLDAVHKKLVRDLKSKCKVDVNETLLKLLLEGASFSFEEACISQLPLKKGCYIGTIGHWDEESCGLLPKSSHGVENPSRLAFQLIHEAVNELEEEDSVNREPIILVLDCEVQMLPWENIPILRNQEVYRMPSVASISVTLDRSRHYQEQIGMSVAAFPFIDPLDAFYLLNPSGDLSSTQVEFENWFRDQKLEGKAGSAPTSEELSIALKNHDLFIYFGHGSGAQYISKHEIQKLEKCAATLLMGCSSGSLSLNGCYIPQGMPLSYLLAGSPAIVANLWEVTDKDIDRFGKAMLDAWLRERASLVGCAQCNLVVKEFEAMNVRGTKGNAKKKVSRKKLPETCNSSSGKNVCDHRPKIGSFMGKAREACTLPFLIGASPVCYGVPTGIRRKKEH